MLRKDSARYYLLMSLVPYSHANINLATHPNKFFNELERRLEINKRAVETAQARALRAGHIIKDSKNRLKLTQLGERLVAPYISKKLSNAQLMIIFDIPEVDSYKRRLLRAILKEFHFEQIQKSVWITKVDCEKYVRQDIAYLGLNKCVKLFETIELK